ncbi:hypothetical protein [Geitlerinema sp. PCC 9228]|jgi:hypothetical protein|uniref:hypothetical protein n=1 Tax=Geitlerinema sp. PCC 9228 TaxID=111611 RepID=UPI0008F9A582|nr:hypothetical protein [Geitlerinema sp. PCC 9228]
MLARFQAKYPGGSLISELLTIHEGKYVVKVLAQIDGKTLATALAAADTVEAAEDRARDRVLIACDINPSAATEDPPPSPTPVAFPEKEMPATPMPSPTNFRTEAFPMPAASPASGEHTTSDFSSNTQLEDDDTQPAPPAKAVGESPVDLSDIIVQTDIEMKRLGWGKEEGRRYLEATYNKRSRQQLTEAELHSFLEYLRSLPTPEK